MTAADAETDFAVHQSNWTEADYDTRLKRCDVLFLLAGNVGLPGALMLGISWKDVGPAVGGFLAHRGAPG